MHERRCLRHVPERRRAEAAILLRITSDVIAARVGVALAVIAQPQIVEAAVAEGRAMVAVQAAGLPPKEIEPQNFSVGQGCGISLHEAVEPRPSSDDRPFKAGQRLDHPGEFDRPVREGGCEKLLVFGNPSEQADDIVAVGGHFGGIGQGIHGLLLEARGSTIPEQRRLKRGVADRGRVPARLFEMRLAHRPTVRPAEVWLVAGDAGDLAAGGQAGVEEEHLAKCRLGVVEGIRLGMDNGREEPDLFPFDAGIDVGGRPGGWNAPVDLAQLPCGVCPLGGGSLRPRWLFD